MKKKEVKLTAEFKIQAIRAVISICFFIIAYISILLLAIGLTALCIIGSLLLVSLKPTFITIAFGIGLTSLGILILIFLLKFIFSTHKVDNSHLVEINESQEPKLFSMINEIVHEVGTTFPKKVYLSSEVNASVFYDPSFWSMFFPLKKNLQIGLGLVNTVSKVELKAILAHEFGHFSQRTMKVGSYVDNVNQIIFNMLYENESYENLIESWANLSGIFSFFVVIAVRINEGIQWIIKKLYEVVNKSYLGLSREMEFHADEIAANVTGYEPLKKSLLRMSLADNSFNNVLDYYNGKVSENIKSDNLYRDQTAVFHFMAEVNSLNIANGLPDISLEEQSRFNKSKLVIKNQWDSHPTIDERIKRLEKTGITIEDNSDVLANTIFTNIVELQKQLTIKMFESISYEGETKVISFDKFIEEYKQASLSDLFSNIYNGYYDYKNPTYFDLSEEKLFDDGTTVNELFSDEKVDMVYSAIGLQNDIETLKNISNNTISIKTYDYNGVRYKRKKSQELIEKLKIELENINEKIKINDADIYKYFLNIENQQSKPKKLKCLYNEFFEFDKTFDVKFEIYNKLINELQFVNTDTSFEEIRINFNRIKSLEVVLKQEITQIFSDNIYTSEITQEIKHNLMQYTSKTWDYFIGTNYYEENLKILYLAIHNFAYLLSRKYFLLKKAILKYQEELIDNQLQ